MQGSRAENEEIRQCHPYSDYHVLHHCYNTRSPIFFFRQHDSSKCRDFTLGIDLEGCGLVFCRGNHRDRDNDFSAESSEIGTDIHGA